MKNQNKNQSKKAVIKTQVPVRTNYLKDSNFIILALLAFFSIMLAYSNHFNNGFHFDDAHTIVENPAVRTIDIHKFFTDGKTFSTLPANQSYRPYVTLENAIDYKLSGGGGTRYFHVHIFIVFMLVCILLFLLVKKLLEKAGLIKYNEYWALLIATVFGMLCANAETVNYIIQRAEIDSAMFILAGLVAYIQGGFWKKYHLYLIFPLIGFFAKEMAFVFAPLLFLYLLIFDENVDLLRFLKADELKKFKRALTAALPAIIMTVLYFIFYKMMLPETWTSGGEGVNAWLYFITQPYVICHYLVTFLLPYHLSADSDWKTFSSFADPRALTGLIIIIIVIFTALKTSKSPKTRFISFGLLWFGISLLPTSSVLPYSEVMNDHRTFIPYLGLAIAFIFGIKYLLDKFFPDFLTTGKGRWIMGILLVLFLSGNGYGVHLRNKVWHNEVSLWKDVTEKSPENGRGWMNYAVALMGKGDLINAEKYLLRAATLDPNYAYVYINLGINRSSAGDFVEAEKYFKKAISCKGFENVSLYYYGHFLLTRDRLEEAKDCLEKSLELVPGYYNALTDLMQLYFKQKDYVKLKVTVTRVLKDYPGDVLAGIYLTLIK